MLGLWLHVLGMHVCMTHRGCVIPLDAFAHKVELFPLMHLHTMSWSQICKKVFYLISFFFSFSFFLLLPYSPCLSVWSFSWVLHVKTTLLFFWLCAFHVLRPRRLFGQIPQCHILSLQFSTVHLSLSLWQGLIIWLGFSLKSVFFNTEDKSNQISSIPCVHAFRKPIIMRFTSSLLKFHRLYLGNSFKC